MKHSIWQKIKAEIAIWRVGAMPGLAVIGIVMVARLSGVLQSLELAALDRLLRWRSAEPIDQRILIVGINEADIRRIGTYPIPDGKLAALINKLEIHQPAAIGVDLIRDLPVNPGHERLVAAFSRNQNIFGVEKVLPDMIKPPSNLSSEQVGFVDEVLDSDGSLRRSLLSTSTAQGFKFSLSIRLAEAYLTTKGYSLGNVADDEWAMRFGSTELKRFQPNSGGYIRADAGGNQLLLNFRSGWQPFRMVTLEQIESGAIAPSWIRGRIVLIGITALSAKDLVNTPGVNAATSGLIYGVEIKAHAVSQVISAVLDDRPLLKVWSDGWEYLWIVVWGLLGISLTRILQSPWKMLLGLAIAVSILIGISYFLLLIEGLWLPVVPAFLALFLNGAGLTAALFYSYQQNLKLQLEERQFIIDYVFDTIHNGPLQTLKQILRDIGEPESKYESSNPQLINQLQHLDIELRKVYESVKKETIVDGKTIYIGDMEIDLGDPTKEILYQVYNNTISRNFSCFLALKFKIVQFEDIDTCKLTIEQKRGLCRFLEEALCNVGKYAIGATRLKVICTQQQNYNLISIEDNGAGIKSESSSQFVGRGTKQATNLAKQLKGKFQRYSSLKGTICQLRWPI